MMTQTQPQDFAELSRQLMENHYARKLWETMAYMAEDIVWIGPLSSQFLQGKRAMEAMLMAEQGVACEMEEADFREVSRKPGYCVVTGHYKASTRPESGLAEAVHQRITLVWERIGKEMKVTHIHCSNDWEGTGPEETFPFRMEKETYQYMQGLIRQKFGESKKLTFYDISRRMINIDENELICIEADKRRCILHCLGGEYVIGSKISDLEEKLSERFYSPRRSWIINPDYVVSIEHYELTMCRGIKIHIPVQKFYEVRDRIEASIQS
ncbi:MAG: LytTR family transcriptional regulator DNA-binding domain-containing protein [Eubacteriales bacterium]|nr:LytTR family transcriptional regulator DNA-binding domain-containing protein [Eubacteriales bacterium]